MPYPQRVTYFPSLAKTFPIWEDPLTFPQVRGAGCTGSSPVTHPKLPRRSGSVFGLLLTGPYPLHTLGVVTPTDTDRANDLLARVENHLHSHADYLAAAQVHATLGVEAAVRELIQTQRDIYFERL